MSQSYYLWTSYKGIVNVCDTPDPVTSTVTKYVNFLYRGDGDGNQKQFTGKIGHTTYTNFEVLEEDYFNDDTYGVPEGRFICNFPSANDAAAQNLTGGATSYRVSMDSFHDKTGLTDEEKNNFYGEFAISRGFNREYRIKTSEALDSLTQSAGRTESAHQSQVSVNNDSTYVNVDDGEFKIRFTNYNENPFEGIGVLFSFMTYPYKEKIYYPQTPCHFDRDFALICYFDEDVTDLETSHLTLSNCTVSSIKKNPQKNIG